MIESQELAAESASVQTFLRNRYPSRHLFPLDLPDEKGSWETVCPRDNAVLDLKPLIGTKLDMDALSAGCLPDLTLSELLEIARDQGDLDAALDRIRLAAEPIDDLWQWLKGRL